MTNHETWLEKNQHQEIDEHSRNPLAQEQRHVMFHDIHSNVAVGIPQSGCCKRQFVTNPQFNRSVLTFKWILVVDSFAFIQNCAPSCSLLFRARKVKNWNFARPENKIS